MFQASRFIRPDLTITVDAPDIKTLITELAFLDAVPEWCPLCQKEGADSRLRFTLRTPSKNGRTFQYRGLICAAGLHEAQISERTEQKGSGLYIAEGNRTDGKPNWRAAYGHPQDQEPEEQDQNLPPADTPHQVDKKLKEAMTTELKRIGKLVGLVHDKPGGGHDITELNRECGKKYKNADRSPKTIDQLTRDEGIAFRKQLMDM